MKWVALSTVFFSAMIKFMVSPLLGPLLELNYWETYFANLLGAFLSMVVFFFAADFFNKRSMQRRLKKAKQDALEGKPIKRKPVFTRRNKAIIRIKNKVGIVTFCFFAPFFLSIPIGSIIVAKFYGKKKKTFPLMILGIIITNTLTVSIAYLLKYEAEYLF